MIHPEAEQKRKDEDRPDRVAGREATTTNGRTCHDLRLVGFHLIFEKITELLQPRDQRPDVIL